MSTLSVDILGVEECKLLVYYVGMKDEKIVFYSALGFFQLVYIIIHVLVFLFVATFIPAISGYFKWLLGLCFLILCFSFVPAFFATFDRNTFFSRLVYRTAAVWSGVIIYVFFFISLASAFQLIFDFVGLSINMSIVAMVFIASALAVCLYGYFNAATLKIKKLQLKIDNVPDDWKKKKMIFFSDTHFGQIIGGLQANKIVDKINSMNPDIILIGGDIFDGSVVNFEDMAKRLGRLKAVHGVYFITGNHEVYTETRCRLSVIDLLAANNLVCLDGKKIDVNGIDIVGAGYIESDDKNRFFNFISKLALAGNKTTVVIKHVPEHIEVAATNDIDLMLFGHTHNAQIFPFQFLPDIIYRGYGYGLKKFGRTHVYTSSGVGTWGPPFRVGTVSEIVEITFV
ncbi:MAG: hypothetical protein A3G52_04920 [Candidatus Taylorbacteria bacterium RIFCSPLOWO2_12_FULL_43_20]|uniref:Calcineurin-like phosphoesterase domain-containing protein n=1 Tax=Candidatus Taylorbacteria bacterium RIFCSPLOWO2_12_FULL_43_20 TaxID=1802332 RepID=A0A1G2P0W4_9BACT|nr:MAG: hypothetical protein A2825_03385 [Candidatus Taylorbacteria bacterium RIFCSPHIGHO2_01_FULL_43_120]OHA24172.1 MAG: hypothetical protein A3B98_03430 [Candidatus Taylorbacteria bacterium RIFCSPHIGHO2_02_FULL_43_55]OHA30211.1 MAG: hypothetical protein A3E92_01310 [Candidatus Taylorbacteria bacterium RIFCSPHIGHO2_12_FULL_42_34]OHA31960.1 MAG: hypothetical protein A3B09_01070 [Candidatus Taylorbacteria bacterium RIFCSPLOWO2_01_FULL_43_83]OHA37982.1 MAG: hypothetical protein A3H58_01480 [Candi